MWDNESRRTSEGGDGEIDGDGNENEKDGE